MGMFVKVDKDDYAYDYDYTWEKSPISISKFGAYDGRKDYDCSDDDDGEER